ncbi:vitamin B12 dependent-methionine synthase activation domain-containing protein [Lachnotalea glycerini]|nr:vitamin B12 dependent-methionine synthase activation domain-containing protein [Lachnotalea glycerini]
MDLEISNLIDEASEELLHSIHPKSVYKEFDCMVQNETTVLLESLSINSRNLAKNLKGCERAIIFAATIGASADMLIKRYSITNLAKASVVQAAGAALIETYCDTLEETIRNEAILKGLYLRPRFSPGYGDFSLEYQRDFFTILECSKRIGITLTDTCLMIPSKSVTAVIGLSKSKNNCLSEKCTSCSNTACEYRDHYYI